MEMRGADGGPLNMLCALPAFWVTDLFHYPILSCLIHLTINFFILFLTMTVTHSLSQINISVSNVR